MSESIVRLESITKSYGSSHAVNNISLDVKAGEFLTLLGPSGCGKTTTLRMVAGFEPPTNGEVWINKKNMKNVEPYNREINTVFQSYSLFPHMNVFDNIAFGLKMKKVKKQEIKERVMSVLKLVQLEHCKNKKPKHLSGGMQQRIAIARSIVNNPQVLLLDEPLGALDLKLRKQMQLELKHLQQSLGITFIYVTHDQEEALTMSDRIVVMNEGEIEQIDSPREIYQSPKSLFVANFIGETNILEGVVTESNKNTTIIQIGGDRLFIERDKPLKKNESISLSIRPEDISFTSKQEEGKVSFKVTIKEIIYIGSLTKIVSELTDGQKVIIQSSNGIRFNEGDTSYITWKEEKSLVYRRDESLDNPEKALI